MSKLRLLHISDLHAGNTRYKCPKDTAIRIITALEANKKNEINCVVITGDIFDGKADSFESKKEWTLNFLNTLLEELKLSSEDFIIVPGNHDLIRNKEDKKADFSGYTSLLEDFYGKPYFERNFDKEHLFITKIYEKNKVAFVGLNSCATEPFTLEEKDIQWIKNSNFEDDEKVKIKETFQKEKEGKWDDYGYISQYQLRKSFQELERKANTLEGYRIIACFHHHFYPFPEIYNQYGDASIIRNFTDVIDKFQNNNVKIVLHGHKHMPIVRPVTNHKYLSDPNSIFYVFSAGSIAKENVENRSFQVLDIFSAKQEKITDVYRFNYTGEELQKLEEFSIPPKKDYEKNSSVAILEIFRSEFTEEFEIYDKIKQNDTASHNCRADNIINSISKVITNSNYLKNQFKKESIYIELVLYSILYRINHLYSHKDKREYTIAEIKKRLNDLFSNEEYFSSIIELLEYNKAKDFEAYTKKFLNDDRYLKNKKHTALISIVIFFTDLYLTFLKYGEVYFKNEKLNHSINIKLKDGVFSENITPSTIEISSSIERRLITIQFKCSDPTVHKIAVLIVKDYEKRMGKIEDIFGTLDLKIYYLLPKVENDANKYNLENFNFEAYIPTLLPLLTGENLYKEREVFIRELIQNSLDAIFLRDSILRKIGERLKDEEKIINIEIGIEEVDNSNKRKYLKITDNGIGMDSFQVERYFTSIGRSFYKSEEFEELQEKEQIKYNPISNFGIGFLSAFMVAGEIEVFTKSHNSGYALEIHIPNYEGCFFVKKHENSSMKTGTTITLYEDERKYLKVEKIIKYIQRVFVDFHLDIKIKNKIGDEEIYINKFKLRQSDNIKLFCPIVDNKVVDISWVEEVKSGKFINEYEYGILLEFNSQVDISNNIYLNSGILLSKSDVHKFDFEKTNNSICFYNFPASSIALDVARENILDFNKSTIEKEQIVNIFEKQGLEIINNIDQYHKNISIETILNMAIFFQENKFSELEKKYNKKIFYFKLNDNSITLSRELNDTSKLENLVNIYLKVLENIIRKSDTQNIGNNFFDSIKESWELFHKKSKNISDQKFINAFNESVDLYSYKKLEMFYKEYEAGSFCIEELREIFYIDRTFEHFISVRFKYMISSKEFGIEDENFLKRIKGLKGKYFNQKKHRENNKYNMLEYLICANLIYASRRNRFSISLDNIIRTMSLFYKIIAKEVSIEEAKDFEIKIEEDSNITLENF